MTMIASPRPSQFSAATLGHAALFVVLALFFCTAGCDARDGHPSRKSGAKETTAPAEKNGHAHSGEGAAPDEHAHGEHADEVVLTPQAIRINGIRIAKAKVQPLAATIVAPARVTYNAEQMAHVNSVVSGRIKELKVRIGDTINKGDPLLVVDSTELGEAQSDYLQKRTAVETAKPAVEIARGLYERTEKLHKEQGAASFDDVQKLLGEYQTAKGNLQTATAVLTAAENRLHLLGLDQQAVEALAKSAEINPTYIIRSPIAGRVIEREVTLGELVGPEKERLLVIANLNPIWVVADVPEAQLGQVSVNSGVRITVPAIREGTFEGKVAYVQPELDPSTRTARVRVEVKNDGMRLMPGMFATAEIAAVAGGGESAEPVVAVPEEAVQTVEGEPAVFVPVEGEPNTFAKRAVGVGEPIGGMVPIFAGLKEGEHYVASGSFILKAELGKAGAAHEH